MSDYEYTVDIDIKSGPGLALVNELRAKVDHYQAALNRIVGLAGVARLASCQEAVEEIERLAREARQR